VGIAIVRLGSRRGELDGLRIGTVRRPPRGVRKSDYSRLDYYDVWLPQLAPTSELIHWLKEHDSSDATWIQFERRYVRELSTPDNQRLLELLVALSRESNLSVGCYCENEARCHRSILRSLLSARGAVLNS